MEKLQQLHDLILEERQAAVELDNERLEQLADRKARLLGELHDLELDGHNPEIRQLAQTIRDENRRNAYLFWSSLRWVRDILNFYSRQVTEPAYDPAGQAVAREAGGKLISGKV
ncbi:MAG: hypothetical protein D6794_07945 [Deltaproteobacteria bacterium]|nr:MAG: hypothetical protein D6794_07945 [Deltaproteobacteria bacterium]